MSTLELQSEDVNRFFDEWKRNGSQQGRWMATSIPSPKKVIHLPLLKASMYADPVIKYAVEKKYLEWLKSQVNCYAKVDTSRLNGSAVGALAYIHVKVPELKEMTNDALADLKRRL